jgi:mannose-6-phosphate isomerase-like protein (cupin superfamily)
MSRYALVSSARGVGRPKGREPQVSSGPQALSGDHERIRQVQAEHGYDSATTILTSRDEIAVAMMEDLPAEGLARGFEGRLLPVVFGTGTDADIAGLADATTDLHSHETNTFHQILSGTVRITGQDRTQELSAGDWAYIPADVEYMLEAGPGPITIRYRHW